MSLTFSVDGECVIESRRDNYAARAGYAGDAAPLYIRGRSASEPRKVGHDYATVEHASDASVGSSAWFLHPSEETKPTKTRAFLACDFWAAEF
ncbi:hypothetical protein MTO96_034691 [Rhipicephalus appendiculatus]